MRVRDEIFLSTSGKLAQALASRYSIPVVLINGTSCTDGQKLYFDMKYGSYEGELKKFYDGILDHEIAHLKFTQFFPAPGIQNVLTDSKAISIFSNRKYNDFVQHFEDIRVNRLMSQAYIGCKQNIEYTEQVLFARHLKNMKNGKLIYDIFDRCILAIRTLNYELYYEQYFKDDEQVIKFMKVFKKTLFDKFMKIANTTENIFFAKTVYDLIYNLFIKPEEQKSLKQEEKKEKEKNRKEENKKQQQQQQQEEEEEEEEKAPVKGVGAPDVEETPNRSRRRATMR